MQAMRKGDVVMLLTNPATYDRRPLKEAHFLAGAGYSVTILAWDRELETKRDSVFADGLVVKRMRVGAGHGTPFLTVPKLLLFYLWCLVHLVSSRPDVVHCHDVDSLPAGIAWKAASPYRRRLVYDMHDLPEAFLRFFPFASFTQRMAMAFAKKTADRVVVVNDRFVSYLGSLGFDRKRLVVVMNAPPAGEGRERRKVGVIFRILYYGWLGEERGVRLLLDAVKGLENVLLQLAGRGELEGTVKEAATKDPRIEFKGWLKMDALEPLIREADLIPSLYEPSSRNAKLATPGKLLTSMSLSLPSLVPAGSYQAEIVQKFGCGIVAEWNDSKEIRESVSRLAQDPALYDRLSKAAYSAFLTAFSWDVMTRRLSDAYAELIPRSEQS